jgi:hypothetical protein
VTIFGVPWSLLRLEDVKTFLKDAGGEPLTWEAKGTELPHPGTVAKHLVGFANGLEPGYLLLGFGQEGDVWKTTGLKFPRNDPPVWVANVVRDLRPIPRVDVRDWPVGKKRAGVVRVEPVAEPPCATRDAQIFQRLPGATEPVREASELRRLYERGEVAAARAEKAALRAIDAVRENEGETRLDAPFLILELAVAPVGTAPDISARVFTADIPEWLQQALEPMLKADEPLVFERGFGEPKWVRPRIAQDHVTASTRADLAHTWHLRASWDGSVAILLRALAGKDSTRWQIATDQLVHHALLPMAAAAEQVARAVGGYGRAHVVINALAHEFVILMPLGLEAYRPRSRDRSSGGPTEPYGSTTT